MWEEDLKSQTNIPRRTQHLFCGGNVLVGDRLGLKVLLPLPFMPSWKIESQVFVELCYDFSSSVICTRTALGRPSVHSRPLEGINIKNNRPGGTPSFELFGAQQTKPQLFGICDISIIGRGNGQLTSLESELEGTYRVGFSSPLICWGEILRLSERKVTA